MRIHALCRKELSQFMRARFLLIIIFYLYSIEIFMCTYSMSFDVRNLPTAFSDLDASPQSRRLRNDFTSSGYFDIRHDSIRDDDIKRRLNRGDVLAVLVVPPEFSRQLEAGKPVSVQLLLDGANANAASIAYSYAARIVRSYATAEAARHATHDISQPIEHRPRIWYNSELRYSYFTVLSMIAISGMMIGVITAAAGVVREKESGTLDQLFLTPARPWELLAAKMLPPLLVGLIALVPSLVIAGFVGVPMRGSIPLFFLLSAIFLLSNMSIGFLIATITRTLQQALLVSFLLLFPVLFLSGTIVPLESMPIGLQYFANLTPLRHYLDIVLGIFFKGIGLEYLWPQVGYMLVIGAVFFVYSLIRFKGHDRP